MSDTVSDTVSDTMNENVFDIPAYNFDHLRERIERLNRRAKKLGCQPIALRVVREFEVKKRQPDTKLVYKQARLEIEVIGESPKFEGWTLLAAIEMLDNGENLVRTVPGQTVPEVYRSTDTHCDHCQALRRRKEVFVLGHEDGRIVQVGRQCIADFLGHVSALTLAARAGWEFSALDAAREAEDEDFCWGGGRGGRMRDIREFLGTVAICIRRLGWKSRRMIEKSDPFSDEQTTGSTAWMILTNWKSKFVQELIKNHSLYAEERDEKLAGEALAWARAIPAAGVSNYEYNLGVACRQESVNYKTIGLVASAVSAYLRHLERIEELNLRKKQDRQRKHLGEVGQRFGFAGCEVKAMKYFEGTYGVRTLVRFETPDGNIIVWWASKELDDWNVGDTMDITGTVTKHGDYHGCPQTELKRVVEGLPKTKKGRKKTQNTPKTTYEEPILASEATF